MASELKYKVLEYFGWINVFIGMYDFYEKILRDKDNPIVLPLAIGAGAVALGRYLNNRKSDNLEDKID